MIFTAKLSVGRRTLASAERPFCRCQLISD